MWELEAGLANDSVDAWQWSVTVACCLSERKSNLLRCLKQFSAYVYAKQEIPF